MGPHPGIGEILESPMSVFPTINIEQSLLSKRCSFNQSPAKCLYIDTSLITYNLYDQCA